VQINAKPEILNGHSKYQVVIKNSFTVLKPSKELYYSAVVNCNISTL